MNRNSKLDEMQIQKRNKIGNNCFMLMFYMLFTEAGLYQVGIKWLDYPLNVFVIITICMGYYLIRIILIGSYLGVRSGNKNSKNVIVGIIICIFLLISEISITIFLKGNAKLFSNLSILIIIITLTVLIFLSILALGNISRHKSDSGED